jgi:predicted dehydrogenase
MREKQKLGIIGLDASHVEAFTRILQDSDYPHHVSGAHVTVAFPGETSEDFPLSHNRVQKYTSMLRDELGVEMVDSCEAVAEQADTLIIQSADARVHRKQFEAVAPFGKPTYINKPLALSSQDAEAMAFTAFHNKTPLMSCSSLRFASALTRALKDDHFGAITGVDAYGPMPLEPTQPGFFWYGVHTVELLFAAFGSGCAEVSATTTADHDLIIARWRDGRLGTIRGNRTGNMGFYCVIHRETGTQWVDIKQSEIPLNMSLIENILQFSEHADSPVPIRETLEIIRFMEAANKSQSSETGKIEKV